MEQPKIAAKGPIKITLEPGTYYWCACGKSKNQPFCDKSHIGSGFTPVAFNINEKKDAWLCRCKRTGNKPFCDGTHNKL